jgi:hypothetical protein
VTLRTSRAHITGIGSVLEAPCPAKERNWILCNFHFPTTLLDEWNQSSRNVSAVSDGSFKNGHGTAAWIVVISPTCTISGSSVAPGEPEDQSAYRSKLTGIYGIVLTICHLVTSLDASWGDRTHDPIYGMMGLQADGYICDRNGCENLCFDLTMFR